jgi:GT2 family glycosyltransferase
MVSIIIPTYTNAKGLVECVESVKKYTDMSQVELIVVANGAPEESRKYATLWFDEPLGYAKAVNAGIRAAKGDYIVLLNDDCVLLPQPVNKWIEMLRKPFDDDRNNRADVSMVGNAK